MIRKRLKRKGKLKVSFNSICRKTKRETRMVAKQQVPAL